MTTPTTPVTPQLTLRLAETSLTSLDNDPVIGIDFNNFNNVTRLKYKSLNTADGYFVLVPVTPQLQSGTGQVAFLRVRNTSTNFSKIFPSYAPLGSYQMPVPSGFSFMFQYFHSQRVAMGPGAIEMLATMSSPGGPVTTPKINHIAQLP